MPGFFDGLLEKTQNPLFLGGLGLLTGGGAQGMMQGMQVGSQFQDRQRKLQQEEARKQALGGALGGLGLKPEEMQFLQADPEVGGAILKSIYADRFDPMAGLRKKQAEAQLAQTQAEAGMTPLKQQLLESQIAQNRAQIEQGRNGKYGLQPVYGVDANGNPVIMQVGPSGEAVQTRLPEGVRIDLGAKARAQEEGKIRGEALAQGQVDLPRQADNASLALRTIESIRQHPGKATGLGWSAPAGSIPNTQARGFANLVDQAKGQTFLEAFNSLRGGGQITEAEGAKATQALSRLDRYQSAADFDAALKDLEDVIKAGLSRARKKAGMDEPSNEMGGSSNLRSKYGLE